jgi:hypothetical protein
MANTKPQITIFDCETQETIVRDATAEEIASIEQKQIKAQAKKAEDEAQAKARIALLDKLGITAEEAVLLLS